MERVAIVTGGSEGIGRGIVLELARTGWCVAVANRRLERGVPVAQEAEKLGGKAIAVRTDVAAVADCQRLVEETVKAFGRVDLLVNNAGVYPVGSAVEMSEEEWDRVLDTNLKGSFFCAQAAARHMIEQGNGGRIINITSMTALRPTRMVVHYAASKSGMIGLTKVLALELSDYAITVNALAVGIVRTETAIQIYGQGTPEQVEQFIHMMVPLGREGSPEEIAKIVAFLASPDAAYITGALIAVDGGYTI